MAKFRFSCPAPRESRFEPGLVNKDQPRTDGMDGKMVGLYAVGLTVREWRCRALERMCPVVIFDTPCV